MKRAWSNGWASRARIVEGSYDNIKITTQEDVELGQLILERWRTKGLV